MSNEDSIDEGSIASTDTGNSNYYTPCCARAIHNCNSILRYFKKAEIIHSMNDNKLDPDLSRIIDLLQLWIVKSKSMSLTKVS